MFLLTSTITKFQFENTKKPKSTKQLAIDFMKLFEIIEPILR